MVQQIEVSLQLPVKQNTKCSSGKMDFPYGKGPPLSSCRAAENDYVRVDVQQILFYKQRKQLCQFALQNWTRITPTKTAFLPAWSLVIYLKLSYFIHCLVFGVQLELKFHLWISSFTNWYTRTIWHLLVVKAMLLDGLPRCSINLRSARRVL